jgi:hypothetical protein
MIEKKRKYERQLPQLSAVNAKENEEKKRLVHIPRSCELSR